MVIKMINPKELNDKITNCELCGTIVKIVGSTTKHYEPIDEFSAYLSDLIKTRSEIFDELKRVKLRVKKLEAVLELMNDLKCQHYVRARKALESDE